MRKPATVASFLSKYDPAIAAQVRDVRAHLSSRFPRGYELVYDNYNALVFGFSPSARASATVVSVAAYPRWVTLFFLDGVSLPDPHGVLEGAGRRVRGVRLAPPDALYSAPVQALLDSVVRETHAAFAHAPPLATVVKSVSAKQRPRKPAVPKASSTRGGRTKP